MKEKKIGLTVVRLLQGDITTCEVDALIVTADNSHLMMTSELGESVKTIGGAQIEDDAISQGPVETGAVILTDGGNLKARHVIHAMSRETNHPDNGNLIQDLVRKILILAEDQHFESIAIPSIGTGLGGFPVEQCAEIMLQEVKAFIGGHQTLKKIIFVLMNQKVYKAFEKALDRI